MKKVIIFLVIVLILIAGFSIIYFNYKVNYNSAKKENLEFEDYCNREIFGTDVATLINKAMNRNMINNVEKDNNEKYQNNNINSINIDIKMLDNDTTYDMETIYNGKIENFVQFYSKIKFKCTNIQYHEQTKKVKYMLIEQISN